MEKRRQLNGMAVAVLLLFSGLVFAQTSNQQRELEKQFDAAMKAENLRNWMKRMSARPHHVGSPYGKENAEFIVAQFKSWGYDAQIE